ncbi:MAG: hypothetical protein F6K18_19765 [Okeania sp. SIO2C2]|uniref:TcdA/TcdB pore-forming domain-containing protein n=1 Tax=Okeania sp. SIO2C2 TaxID=2607787 RepID=UPI0013B7BAD1|nr:TcdA/TcdB pore-forming domain-containing protein [Okeania sp. SIO2C2]NEP88893.1 hypothetical protein [Okeania sp. SIO2C2]
MTQNRNLSGFGHGSLVQSILDIYLAVEQTERWRQAVKNLNQQAHLNFNWIPIIQNVRSIGGGQYQVQFIDKQNPSHEQWIDTTDRTFEDFKAYFNTQAQGLGAFFQVDSVTGAVSARTSTAAQVSAGVGIGANKGDLVKAIIGWVSEGELYEKSGNPDLDTAVGAQSYLNLVQYGHGVATEVTEVIRTIRPALKNGGTVAREVSESLVSTVVRTAATEGLGAVLNIANVVLDGIVLANTSSSVERASVTTTLVFDAIGTASSLLALGLGIAGASTAASIIGAIAVPVAGLAAGIPTLVELYKQRAENAKKAAEPFGIIGEGYAANDDGTRGVTYTPANQYTGTPSVLKPKGGAVITGIDLVNNTLTFGSQYLYQVNPDHPGSGHSRLPGSNRDTFVAGPDVGRASQRAKALRPVSTRNGLGCPSSMSLQNRDIDVIILPRDIEIIFDYEHSMVTAFWQERVSSPGINALRQIESHSGGKFWYDYYAGSDFAISQFYPDYRNTTVTVNLDKARRSVVIPQVADIERDHLTYLLQGHGGTYIVVLSEQDINIQIQASNDPDERWIFNIDSIGRRDHSTWLRYPDSWTVVFHDDGFTIGQHRDKDESLLIRASEAQRVRFRGTMPKNVVLKDNLGHIFVVNLEHGNMSLILNITQTDETDPNLVGSMKMTSRSLLYRAHVSYQYLTRAANWSPDNDVETGILKSVPLINANNIGIIFEDRDASQFYMGTWDKDNFALVTYYTTQTTRGNPPQTYTSLKVDRYNDLATMDENDVPSTESFSGSFENVWTANNEIFFTQKIPTGSGAGTIIQYCKYRGEGYTYIDAINANASLMDQILAVPLSELNTSKVDRLLDAAGLIHQMEQRPIVNRRDYIYGKDAYTIVGKNSHNIPYRITVHKQDAHIKPSLSWKEGGIEYQILSGYTLKLTGTKENNAITLRTFSNYPSLKRAILFGEKGIDTYHVDQAILHYEAIFILNYAKDTNQDTLRLTGLRTTDFSYIQQGEDIVLTHKQTEHWINIVGASSSNTAANLYQHLQLQFDDATFSVTEVPNRLSLGNPNVINIFINLEDVIFDKQGNDLVVSQKDKIDSIVYSNFYNIYSSLNSLEVKFPYGSPGNSLSLNAQKLAELGQNNKSGITASLELDTSRIPGLDRILDQFKNTHPGSSNVLEWNSIRDNINHYSAESDVVQFQHFVETLNNINPGVDNRAEWAAIRTTCSEILRDWATTQKQLLFTKLLNRFESTNPGRDNRVEWEAIRRVSTSILNP